MHSNILKSIRDKIEYIVFSMLWIRLPVTLVYVEVREQKQSKHAYCKYIYFIKKVIKETLIQICRRLHNENKWKCSLHKSCCFQSHPTVAQAVLHNSQMTYTLSPENIVAISESTSFGLISPWI